MTVNAHESALTRFVHALIITGGWLDEVNRGLALELPQDRFPGENMLDVVFQMLCETIAAATESVSEAELRRATEIIDFAAAQVEEDLRVVDALGERPADDGDGNGNGNGNRDRPNHG
jgi:hypothetical protein